MMRSHLTMEELTLEFYGPAPRIVVEFFDKEVTDTQASKRAGRRVMREAVYIHLVCHREEAEITRPATEEDRKRFAKEYRAYQEKKDAESDAGHCEVPDLQQVKAGVAG